MQMKLNSKADHSQCLKVAIGTASSKTLKRSPAYVLIYLVQSYYYGVCLYKHYVRSYTCL